MNPFPYRRWLVVWKYGGLYLDFDSFVVKKLPWDEFFTGRESDDYFGAGVMRFPSKHPLIAACIENVRDQFNTDEYGSVGPILLTNVMKQR